MNYHLGADVGSVNVKLVLLDESNRVVQRDVEKVTSNPRVALNALINRLGAQVDLTRVVSAGVSGSGKGVIPGEFAWTGYSSSLAIAAGLLHEHSDARTIIQIGGQSSLIIGLEDGLRKPWKVASNSLCAAGTGRFLEQQAYRLGITMADFSDLALRCEGNPPRIAARCSVFAKSDLIHLQQKGTPLEVMLYALCESIARMVVSLKKGIFQEPVYFVGGVAANEAIIRSLSDLISTRNGHETRINVPDNYLYYEALGAALLATGKGGRVTLLPGTDASQRYFEMPGLQPSAVPITGMCQEVTAPCSGYLGIDVGSTSTKAVIINQTGTGLLAKNYLMTAGKPVDAVKEVFRNLLKDGAGQVRIIGVGVTGSGRYLVGSFVGADLIKNEITAQTRAGIEIDADADIIEIGGQDSKLVLKRNGVVVDYQMNKACAAGTGSFIDELAEMLGVSVKSGEFASLAFDASHTIDLGTRCAAFMGQAVASAQQEGVPLEVIIASLANSIARNYLSKVVGNRKLGKKVILTGAVFHNQAVVSAFRQQLQGKILTVAEHREVSGAIGVALLVKEALASQNSKFKGFQDIIDSECSLSTFVCKACDNNCTITRMEIPGQAPTYYGSRCDRYDSTTNHRQVETAFDDRERLLFKDYQEGYGNGPSVGIPRALLVYDYAPLLISFLNALKVRVTVSGKTTKDIMEQAVELSYADSCFPLKLLHGHAVSLNKVDYILYPCAIRLGEKDGDENQKYACPLVQASPFIIKQTLDLKERLLSPIIDLSQGETELINNLTDTAGRMGFSRTEGKRAALVGVAAQKDFETKRIELGQRLLEQLRDSNRLGVVLLARAYMSQDAGANLGIAEKLAQLGVVPVPLDFLPLASVDSKKYSDRPYWSYESKLIAGAVITASDPHLYGMVLTNFGCGPNSFILKVVEDIMGSKPMGQLEIDEHAAEAGIVTRLEAFVDTISGYAHSNRQEKETSRDIYRGTSASINSGKMIIVPRMSPHAELMAAAMNACGARAIVLPEPDERNLLYSNEVTTGTECLPYRVTLGDFLKFHYEDKSGRKDVEGFMTGSYGPCRLGKYAIEQIRVLKDVGFDIPIRTTVSNNAYHDIGLGPQFERLAWQGILATDNLQKLLWRTRPYEKRKGLTDQLFDEYLARLSICILKKEDLTGTLNQAVDDFGALIDRNLPRNPLVGINGEIFLRQNRFSNNNLALVCEAAGLEVVISPVGEWINYTLSRGVEDAFKSRDIKRIVISHIKKYVREHDERQITGCFRAILDEREPTIAAVLAKSGGYLSPRCGSEAVLSIGTGVGWMESPEFAGVISVMPHGCMPGGIVASMSEKFSTMYQKPWVSLTYDGFMETNNAARIQEFAEQVKFSHKKASEK